MFSVTRNVEIDTPLDLLAGFPDSFNRGGPKARPKENRSFRISRHLNPANDAGGDAAPKSQRPGRPCSDVGEDSRAEFLAHSNKRLSIEGLPVLIDKPPVLDEAKCVSAVKPRWKTGLLGEFEKGTILDNPIGLSRDKCQG
jgi:hypothetical protein